MFMKTGQPSITLIWMSSEPRLVRIPIHPYNEADWTRGRKRGEREVHQQLLWVARIVLRDVRSNHLGAANDRALDLLLCHMRSRSREEFSGVIVPHKQTVSLEQQHGTEHHEPRGNRDEAPHGHLHPHPSELCAYWYTG